jgi:hypothetical protein
MNRLHSTGVSVREKMSELRSANTTVAVSGSSASVSGSVEGDPAPFLKALRPPAGWTMDEPRLNRADAVTRLTMQLRPADDPTVRSRP